MGVLKLKNDLCSIFRYHYLFRYLVTRGGEEGLIKSNNPSKKTVEIYRKNLDLDGEGLSIIPCACAVFAYITKRL